MNLFKPFFANQPKEKLVVAFFDSGLRLRSVKELATGIEDSFRINSKDIVREAITFNAYYVAIAHNHPAAEAMASKADINATSSLKNQLEYFDIRLFEHIIFGTDGVFSFASDDKFSCFISSKGDF